MRSESPPPEDGLTGGFVGSFDGTVAAGAGGTTAAGGAGGIGETDGLCERGGGAGIPSPAEGEVIARPFASTGA